MPTGRRDRPAAGWSAGRRLAARPAFLGRRRLLRSCVNCGMVHGSCINLAETVPVCMHFASFLTENDPTEFSGDFAMGPFPHDAPAATISADNPMGTDGFEFVE